MKLAIKALEIPFEGGPAKPKLYTLESFKTLFPEAAQQLTERGTCEFYTLDANGTTVQIRAERIVTYGLFGD